MKMKTYNRNFIIIFDICNFSFMNIKFLIFFSIRINIISFTLVYISSYGFNKNKNAQNSDRVLV